MKKITGYPLPFGVSVRNDVVNFSIAVESGKRCELHIYKKGMETPETIIELLEEDAVGEVRFAALPKAKLKGKEYNYIIDGKPVIDPYVKSVSEVASLTRGKIITESYDWEGDKPLELSYHEVVAYSLHVRGFTKHKTSKVKKKGTFQGIVEKIPYLLELGINQIQCMPVYAFEEGKKFKNYWGYGPAFCFAIKNHYAAKKDAETELKDMVKACHKNGIEVILHMPFTEETPNVLIQECLRYYLMEYHIDGFILNPYVAPMKSILSDPILKKTKILTNHDGFQNTMRRFLKGEEPVIDDVMTWLKQTTKESGSCNYITNHTGFTLVDLVSYNEKHNEANGENNVDGPDVNYSWNCGVEGPTRKNSVLELRKKQIRNAMFLTVLSQGTPCILAGDEFGNSQDGNNNVYCQDNELSWLNWSQLEKDASLYEFLKTLIRIRKEYSVFGTKEPLTGTDKTGSGVPDVSFHGENAWQMTKQKKTRKLGVFYHGIDGLDCFVAYNMHREKQILAMPSLGKHKKWSCILSTECDMISECEQNPQQKEIIVPGRCIMLFIGK